ncbi:MAG: hypothetical protein IKV51_07435, partial [Clostridia bacterium]|nr:hypothetical protein [Clostridia bacterium]
MKKLLLLLVCVLLACFVAGAENLAANPGFETEPGEDEPACWYTDAWKQNSSFFEAAQEDGENALHIFSFEANDARWVQDITVEPDTVYQISCLIKASCDGTGRGANISILNSGASSVSVFDTEGGWQEVRLTGKTGKDQYEISLALRLGGYGGDCAGDAWFKQISVTKGEGGSAGTSFATFEPSSYTSTDMKAEELPDRQTEKWTLYVCLCGIMMICLYNSVKRRPADGRGLSALSGCVWFAVLALLGLAVRSYYAYSVRGYSTDINCFAYWGELFYERGRKFYATDSFCDYPPVYMALLGLVSALRRLFGFEYLSAGHIVLIKLFPMLADVFTAGLVYHLFSARGKWGRGLLPAAAILFNPAYLADSAAWGQADSLLALLVCLTVYLAISDRWWAALPVFALAVMTKPQALLFGPIGLLFLLPGLREKKKLIHAGVGMAAALVIMYFGSLPFAKYAAEFKGEAFTLLSPVSWLFGQMALLVCFMVCLAVSEKWWTVLPLLALAAVTKSPGLLLGLIGLLFLLPWFRNRKRLKLAGIGLATALIIVYFVCLFFTKNVAEFKGETITPFSWLFGQLLGATGGYKYLTVNACNLYQALDFNWVRLDEAGAWGTFSWVMLAASYLYAAFLAWAGKSAKHLPLTGAVLMCLIYAFAPMMHERYLFCALPLLLMGYVYSFDRRILWGFILVTCTQMLNIILVLQWGTTPGFEAYGHLVSSEHVINARVGAVNVIGALFMA